MSSEIFESLRERLPSFQPFSWGRRRIPLVQQVQAADCGAACLAMVLRYHGSQVPLDELIGQLGGGRNGVTAHSLVEVARGYGLLGRGLRIELDDLPLLSPGAILHWEFDHFVVFSRVRGDQVEIVDPAVGRRQVSLDQFSESFTGVAVELEVLPEFVRRERPPSALLRVAWAAAWRSGLFPRILLVSFLLQIATFLVPLLLAMIVNRVIPQGDPRLLWVVSSGCFVAILFVGVASLIRNHLLLPLRARLDSELTLGFVQHLVSLPFSFFQARPAGDLLLRVNSNAHIREMLSGDVLGILIDGSFVGCALLVLAIANPGFCALVIVLSVLRYAPSLVLDRRIREQLAQELRARGRSQAVLVDLLLGMESLKAMGRERSAMEKWVDRFVDELNISIGIGRTNAWIETIRSVLEVASPLVLLLFGTEQVLDRRLDLGAMLALYALSLGALAPLSQLARTTGRLLSVRAYTALMDDVLRATPEGASGGRLARPQLKGTIRAEGVSFRYSQRSSWIVQDLTVSLQPGQTVALVGRSGSGKSTAARLVLGLYRPETGRILYDGRDLLELDPTSFRTQLGVVTQGAQLFGSTIREAISLRSPVSLEAIRQAARLACIDDVVMALPMGYETPLIEGVASFSGGERQRFALARALVHRPKILLLDEATSALDTLTEQRILENLAKIGCTRLVIAHRLSTIAAADLILVMDEGRVVEQGRHQELLARGRLYSALVKAAGE